MQARSTVWFETRPAGLSFLGDGSRSPRTRPVGLAIGLGTTSSSAAFSSSLVFIDSCGYRSSTSPPGVDVIGQAEYYCVDTRGAWGSLRLQLALECLLVLRKGRGVMAVRILGPARSRRRRRFLIVPILLVTAAALMWIGGAAAVHDTGAFELDGNATNNPACWATTGTTSVTRCSAQRLLDEQRHDASGATAVDWVAEPNPNSTIFTGGGSKDPQDVSQWAWKDAAAACPTRTTCCTASRRGTTYRADGDRAVLRLGPPRQQRRRTAGVLVLPEPDRASATTASAAASASPACTRLATCWWSPTSATAARRRRSPCTRGIRPAPRRPAARSGRAVTRTCASRARRATPTAPRPANDQFCGIVNPPRHRDAVAVHRQERKHHLPAGRVLRGRCQPDRCSASETSASPRWRPRRDRPRRPPRR